MKRNSSKAELLNLDPTVELPTSPRGYGNSMSNWDDSAEGLVREAGVEPG